MKRLLAALIAAGLVLSAAPVMATAAGLGGTSCSTLGKTKIYKGFKYKCKKSSGTKKWVKGKRVSVYPLPAQSSTEAFSDWSECKLQVSDFQTFGRLGFPRHPRALKNTGDLRGLMVFVQFTDVKGDDNPLIEGPKFTTKFEQFYKNQSYGKLNIKVDIHPTYLDISRPSSDYGMNVWDKGSPVAYFSDGVAAAAKVANLSDYDFLVVMPPSGIKEIIYGPAFPPGYFTEGIVPGKPNFAGTVGGADQRTKGDSTGWIWLGHEIGHLFGFVHQYGYWPSPVWDLMDNVYITVGPELFGWHRFIQDWMSESQVACLNTKALETGSKIVVPLTPIQAQDSDKKLALLRLSDSQVIAIEYRGNKGFDQLGDFYRGALAYKVNVRAGMNEAGIRLVAPSWRLSTYAQSFGTMKVGDTVESDGYKISVLYLSAEKLMVQIERVAD